MITTALRLIDTLALIPTSRDGRTAIEIRQGLLGRGWQVHLRTVQRDLTELSARFPLQCFGKPHQWRWMPQAAAVSIPGQEIATALVWRLVDQSLSSLMPPSLLDELGPSIRAAGQLIEERGHPLSRWVTRVARVAATIEPCPPAIEPEVFREVAHGLLASRVLEISYTRRYETGDTAYRVNPLGLVHQGAVIYLVASRDDSRAVRHFALHRIRAAKALELASTEPEGFRLDEYLASGAFGYQADGRIDLEVRFDAAAGFHLTQSRISDDQTITTEEHGSLLMRATVQDTSQLRWWLLGFADQVEVVGPAWFRKEMAERTRRMAAVYQHHE